MPTVPRLLVFGIDGASYGLITRLMAAGVLPAFSAFAGSADVAPLRTNWPPHTATGWASMFTGRLPGEHGIFQFWDCQAPDYLLHVTRREDVACPTLWDVLAEHGWTMGIVNVPMSHPPAALPGYQMTWPLESTLHYARPAGLLKEIAEVGGLARPDIACMYDGSHGYSDRAVGYIRARTRGLLHLLRSRPTDAVAVVYPEVDRVCHHYWHGLDTLHPEHDLCPREERGVITNIYIELDAAFASLLDAVGDECVVAVVSDHGFGPGTRGLRLHRLLADGGFCRLRPGAAPTVSRSPLADRAADDAALRDAVIWGESRCYTPTPGCFGVNLNLVGRQRHGAVKPFDAATVLHDVEACLLEAVDPVDRGPLLSAVIPAEVAYAGPFAARAPDLLLVPRDPSLLLLHDPLGPAWDSPGQTGLHRIEGICMVRSKRASTGPAQPEVAIEAVAGRLLSAVGLESQVIPQRDAPSGEAPQRAGLPPAAWSSNNTPGVTPLSERRGPSPRAGTETGDLPAVTADDIEQRLRMTGYW